MKRKSCAQGKQEVNPWQGQNKLCASHYCNIGSSAKMSGNRAENRANQQGKKSCEQRRRNRDPSAIKKPREDVTPKSVRSKKEDVRRLGDGERVHPSTLTNKEMNRIRSALIFSIGESIAVQGYSINKWTQVEAPSSVYKVNVRRRSVCEIAMLFCGGIRSNESSKQQGDIRQHE